MAAKTFGIVIVSAILALLASSASSLIVADSCPADSLDLANGSEISAFDSNWGCGSPEMICTLRSWYPLWECISSANQCFTTRSACEEVYGPGSCESILNPTPY